MKFDLNHCKKELSYRRKHYSTCAISVENTPLIKKMVPLIALLFFAGIKSSHAELKQLVISECTPGSYISCENDIYKKVWLKIVSASGEIYMLDTNVARATNNKSVIAVVYKPDPTSRNFTGDRLSQLDFDCAGHYQELSPTQPFGSAPQIYDIAPLSVAGKIQSLICK